MSCFRASSRSISLHLTFAVDVTKMKFAASSQRLLRWAGPQWTSTGAIKTPCSRQSVRRASCRATSPDREADPVQGRLTAGPHVATRRCFSYVLRGSVSPQDTGVRPNREGV